jgi:hypothetical protein
VIRLRRVVVVVLGLLLGAAGVLGLQLVLGARDKPGVSGEQGPGQTFPDQGRRHLSPGERPHARFASDPPTSGPHVPIAVIPNATTFGDDELLQALELGNVVLAYPQRTAPPALRALAEQLMMGRFTPDLAATGQAVILARRPGLRGVVALYWRHLLRASSPSDPRLGEFASYWLDHGSGP